MKGTIVTCWLAFGSWLAYGSPLTVRALGGTVVIRQSAESGDASLDSTITIDLDGHRDPQPLKVFSQRPKTIQMISTTSDAPFVTCDYTCGHRGNQDGTLVTCGSTTMKSGAKSNILDASWVDSVQDAVCFVSSTDPTAVPVDDGE